MASSRTDRPSWPEPAVWGWLPPLVRAVGRVAWRLEVDHGEGLLDPPFVVAANHHSFLDPFLIGASLRRKVRFLALDDLFGNYRLVDRALTAFNVVPLKRGVVPLGPMRTALAHLSKGGVVGLFPEGTRNQNFNPARVRPGAAWLAVREGVPLVPVAITGTERILGVDNRLRTGRVRIAVGPPMLSVGTDRAAVEELSRRWSGWVADRLTVTSGGTVSRSSTPPG